MELSLNGEWFYSPVGSNLDEIIDWSETMSIPSNWELQGLHNYSGSVWFKREFLLENLEQGSRYWLKFKGVDYFSEVYVNNQKAGNHEGYFQVHEFEVTAYLQQELNEIAVKVTSPWEEPGKYWPNKKRLIKGVLNHHDTRPGSWSAQHGQDQNTGGIWNDVVLHSTTAIKIEKCKVTPHLRGSQAVLTVDLQFSAISNQRLQISYLVQPFPKLATTKFPPHQAATTACQTEASQPSGSGDSLTPGESQTYLSNSVYRATGGYNQICTVISVDAPKLWWTWDQGEQPLYLLTVTVNSVEDNSVLARQEVVFGIREVNQDAQGRIFLNGREVFLRGTNYIPTQWLSEFTVDKIRQDLWLMKQANVNAVRIHAHVTRDEFFSACDEEGIFVWQDFALQWSYQENDEFVTEAVKQIKEMVNQFYNHPSIMIWCCHNEPSTNRQYLDPLLAWAVREEDGKRIVKEASDFTEHVYPGWYHGSYQEYLGLPGAPFVTEFGAQALPNLGTMQAMFGEEGSWPPKWDDWAYHDFQYDETFNVANVSPGNSLVEFISNSQQYQADLLKISIENYRRHRSEITGLFQFMFVDCWPAITWSILDYKREPKQGYWALKLAYEPILVSMEMPRRKLNPGHPLFKQLVAVNDLALPFAGVTLSMGIEDINRRVVFEYHHNQTWNIKANDVSPLLNLSLGVQDFWKVPELEPGRYFLCFSLEQHDKLLTSNREEFEVVQPVQKLDQLF